MTYKEKKNTGKKSPLVSIITPSYNSSRFVEATIRSVLDQDYPHIEYIIIDGGSTDGSLDIIKKYNTEISYWVSEPDDGISDAFNKGIKASRGEIIGILNAGDIYTEGAVATAVKELNNNRDHDFIYGDLQHIDEKNKFLFLMKSDRIYMDKIHYTMPAIQHPTVFMKKEVYDSCGLFDTSYRIAMDYEFFLRITKIGKKGLYVEKTLAKMIKGGLSQSMFYRSYKECCRASIEYGYNPIMAYIRLYIKGMGGVGRVILESLGLHSVVNILRKVFWNVRYD